MDEHREHRQAGGGWNIHIHVHSSDREYTQTVTTQTAGSRLGCRSVKKQQQDIRLQSNSMVNSVWRHIWYAGWEGGRAVVTHTHSHTHSAQWRAAAASPARDSMFLGYSSPFVFFPFLSFPVCVCVCVFLL